MKTARNANCPCGSGRKYKKCCLEADEASAVAAASSGEAESSGEAAAGGEAGGAGEDAAGEREVEAGFAELRRSSLYRDHDFLDDEGEDDEFVLSPYATLAIADEHRSGRRIPKWSRISTLRGAPTDMLVRMLTERGLDVAEPVLRGHFAASVSGWAVGDGWRRQLGLEAGHPDADFLGLAACELWRRLEPRKKSVEMIDDEIASGYRALDRRDPIAALTKWRDAFFALDGLLADAVRTPEAIDAVLGGRQAVHNWLGDLNELLFSVLTDNPDMARDLELLARALVARVRDADVEVVHGLTASLAETLSAQGRVAEARALLEERLALGRPTADLFLTLGDCAEREAPGVEGLRRALAILEDGIRTLRAARADRRAIEALDETAELLREDIADAVAADGDAR